MTTTLLNTIQQASPQQASTQAPWRLTVANILRGWADQISTAPAVHQPRPRACFVSHREDVRAWCAALSPAAREALGGDRSLGKLQGIVHRLRYLPNEETLLDFLRLVPDWDTLHRDFASYLLRRLVVLRHHGRQPDASFGQVHEWLQQRNHSLTMTPYAWAEAVEQAKAGLGCASEAPPRAEGRPLPYDVVRRAVNA